MKLYYDKEFLYHYHMNDHLLSMCINLPAYTIPHKNNENSMYLYKMNVELTCKDHYLIKRTL